VDVKPQLRAGGNTPGGTGRKNVRFTAGQIGRDQVDKVALLFAREGAVVVDDAAVVDYWSFRPDKR
jgi:hypothetical protein